MTTVLAVGVGPALLVVPLAAAVGVIGAYGRRDGGWLLVAFVALLFVFTPRLVVGGLGAGGTPAALAAAAAAAWWAAERTRRDATLARGRQPLRTALWVHGWVMALGYVVALASPTTVTGMNGAHRAMVWLVTSSGLALLAADWLPSRDRLEQLLGSVVLGAAFMGAVGTVQFFTGSDPAALLALPGLVENADVNNVLDRAGFNRPAGTATHPIELGVVMATVLPLAVHLGLYARTTRARRAAWGAVGIIGLALMLSLSRSAVLGLAVAGGVLATRWSWRRRANAAALGIVALLALRLAVPRLISTLRGLFTGAQDDPSVLARVERIDRVREIVAEAPWLGHGYGVHNLDDYLLLDNQVFLTLIESGVVGLAAVVVLFVTGWMLMATTRRAAGDPVTRHLAQALLAALAVPAVTFATFDLLKFRIIASLLFLLLGCMGALWRLAGSPELLPGRARAAVAAGPQRSAV